MIVATYLWKAAKLYAIVDDIKKDTENPKLNSITSYLELLKMWNCLKKYLSCINGVEKITTHLSVVLNEESKAVKAETKLS